MPQGCLKSEDVDTSLNSMCGMAVPQLVRVNVEPGGFAPLSADPLPLEHWDRLDQWLFNIDDPITARFMQRFAVAADQRVFEPGCRQRQMPILLGEQYIGKSELGRALFSDQWYGDGIRAAMDVDDVTLMANCWAVEFAEFDGFTRKTSAAELKAFISRTTDLCRRKYGRGTEPRS
jgi:predicted P-loop ATPase